MNKKGSPYVWTFIIAMVLLLLFAVLFGGGFSSLFRKEIGGINQNIGGASDYDSDTVANFFDRCVCDFGDAENSGCPTGVERTGEQKYCGCSQNALEEFGFDEDKIRQIQSAQCG